MYHGIVDASCKNGAKKIRDAIIEAETPAGPIHEPPPMPPLPSAEAGTPQQPAPRMAKEAERLIHEPGVQVAVVCFLEFLGQLQIGATPAQAADHALKLWDATEGK